MQIEAKQPILPSRAIPGEPCSPQSIINLNYYTQQPTCIPNYAYTMIFLSTRQFYLLHHPWATADPLGDNAEDCVLRPRPSLSQSL